MRKLFQFISLLVMLSSGLYSQTFLDSLQLRIDTIKTDKSKVDFLNKQSSYYRKYLHFDKAIDASNLALEIVEESKLQKQLSKTLSYLGLIKRDQSEYFEAKKLYLRALESAKSLDQKTQMAYGYNNIATIERILSNYSEAIELILKSLELFKELNHSRGQANCYVNLGILYRYQKQFVKSIEYLEEAKKIRESFSNKEGVGMTVYLIGETLYKKGDYYKAIDAYNESLEIYASEGPISEFIQSTVDMALGGTYYELKDYKKALEYRLKALRIIKKMKDKNNLARVHRSLGKIYTKLKNYRLGEKHLKSAIKSAELADLHSRQIEIYLAFSELYKNWNKPDLAYNYLLKYSNLKDEVFTNESKEEISKIEARYLAREAEKENELLTSKLEFESAKVTLFILLSILFFILILLTLFFYKNTKKKNKLLQESNASKDLFFSIISHDVRNPFNVILNTASFIKTEKDISNQEKDVLINNIYSSSVKVNSLLDNLLRWAQNQRGALIFQREFIPLLEIVEESVNLLSESIYKKKLNVIVDIQDGLKIFADRNSIKSVIRNLLNNAIKYSPEKKSIKIIAKNDRKNVCLKFIDEGVGIPQENLKHVFDINKKIETGTAGEKGTGLGLALCKDFVEKNNGKISVESEPGKGSEFSVCLPSEEC